MDEPYSNRHWEKAGDVFQLHFTEWCDDTVIAKLTPMYDGKWNIKSSLLYDYSFDFSADSEVEAKQTAEEAIIEQVSEEIQCLSDLLKKFNEVHS